MFCVLLFMSTVLTKVMWQCNLKINLFGLCFFSHTKCVANREVAECILVEKYLQYLN